MIDRAVRLFLVLVADVRPYVADTASEAPNYVVDGVDGFVLCTGARL